MYISRTKKTAINEYFLNSRNKQFISQVYENLENKVRSFYTKNVTEQIKWDIKKYNHNKITKKIHEDRKDCDLSGREFDFQVWTTSWSVMPCWIAWSSRKSNRY